MKILCLIFVFLFNTSVISNPLVNPIWVSKNLCKENVKLIEVGSSYNSYLVEHIKCSQYTNFYKDGWRSNINGVAMQLPKYYNLVNILKKMGIRKEDQVILYPKKVSDYYAMAETTAIYFSFKLLGHEKIAILDGGYPDFKKKFDLLTEEGEFKLEPVNNYKININKSILANIDMLKNKKNNYQIVDSREKDFYLGINKLKGFKEFGTIKGALNIPSKWFLKSRGLSFNDIKVLKKIYDYSELNREEDTIFFCYSGLESSINWFVAHELMKKKNSRLFEGSIFEWLARGELLHKKL
ncbi:MAG: hypothetical protein CMJ06_00230 [Pelagibacterales bacterium]|nr:hypothetical protein [Pelagibacterales bacterium]OUU63095.1 MAG: hypothetical protein CBC22_02340 [Alphaproteobacteria bacterium TMED62]|tara:strand:+ start:166 stop:1053 length:888 start_codon:yes stop_codon:yes gene_type:complete